MQELKMLGFFLSEYMRGTAHVRRFRDKVREARLRWFGHMERRDDDYL